MARQGKCKRCRIRWIWKENKWPFEEIKCPKCDGRLMKTNYRSGWLTREFGSPETPHPIGTVYDESGDLVPRESRSWFPCCEEKIPF